MMILIFYDFVLIDTLTFLLAGLTEDLRKILLVHDGLWCFSILWCSGPIQRKCCNEVWTIQGTRHDDDTYEHE
ncbi:hypothetical protein ACSQ67_003627 [Phaseolus vulgaris]